MLLNCGVGGDSWQSLGLRGDPSSPFWRRSALGISLEGMMLKLKLQYFGHLMRRVDSLDKTLMLGGIGGRRRRGWQRMRWHHWLDGCESEWTPGVGDGQGGLVCCDTWGHKESDMTERLNWTELMTLFICQGDWTTRIPNSWSNVILSVSVRVFLNETNIWIRRWSKSDCLPQHGWASSNPLIAWIEHKAEEGTFHPFFLSSLEHGSSPAFRLGLGLRLELIPLLLLLRPLD